MVKKESKLFILYFFISFLLLFVGHFLFYFILTDVLSFTSVFPSSAVMALMAFSFLGIFLSQFAIEKFDNRYTSSFYFIVASWIAIAWQAFLVYIGLFVIRALLSYFWLIDSFIFAALFFFFTLLLSWRGFSNAFHPILNELEVEIENLPDYWQGKKIVQLSDVHLGAIYRHKFLNKIAAKVARVKPELVLITGDLFDGTDGDFSEAGKQLLKLNAAHGVYFIFGNHENRLGRSNLLSHLVGSGMELLDNRLVEINGLQIVGISFPEEGTRNFDLAGEVKSLAGFDSLKSNILMFHEPIQFAQVADIGVDLYLAGHTHYGQMFPFNLLANLAYKGYSKGVAKFKQLTSVISVGVGTWGPPSRTMSQSEIVVITLLKK